VDRKQLVLAGLAPADGQFHTPVQVQKLFFLIDRNLATHLGAQFFGFIPYNYGPFDKAVYETLEELATEGLVTTVPQNNWTAYGLTEAGQKEGDQILASLAPSVQKYIRDLSAWVRGLTFAQLVSAIYKAYPNMRANSIFQG